MAKNLRQHGYSIVEVAIALAVVGIVMGGLSVPIGNQLREQVYERASLQMGEIVDAIVGYAVANRTNGFMVAHSNYANNRDFQLYGNRLTRIAPGRPFLPCPDYDGDGFEDRVRDPYRPSALDRLSPYPDTLTVNQIDVLTTTDDATSDPTDFPMSGATTSNRQLPFGECEAHSGFLPYNTLGLKPGDPWGSAHTYIVNPNFAVGAIGFDQHTRGHYYSPMYETNFPEGANNNLRAVVGAVMTGSGSARRFNMERPLLACHYRDSVCWQDLSAFTAKGFDTGTGSRLTYNASGGNNVSLAGHSFYMPEYGLVNAIGGINDSLPFAVISHGLNRAGAGIAQRDSGTIQCGTAPTFGRVEFNNAAYNGCNGSNPLNFVYGRTANDHGQLAGVNSNIHLKIFASHRSATTANETFVGINTSKHTLLTSPYSNEFDDLVTWLTRRELVARMQRAGVFPLPETDIFTGFNSYFATYNI